MARDPINIWFKKYWLLFRYYFRSIIRRTSWIPPLLFAISFTLFALILLPGFRQRLRESVATAPLSTFYVSGTVFEEIQIQDGTKAARPAPGIVIEVGGSHTTSNANGAYELQFFSPSKQGVPIIFRKEEREVVDRISFPEGDNIIKKDFIFR